MAYGEEGLTLRVRALIETANDVKGELPRAPPPFDPRMLTRAAPTPLPPDRPKAPALNRQLVRGQVPPFEMSTRGEKVAPIDPEAFGHNFKLKVDAWLRHTGESKYRHFLYLAQGTNRTHMYFYTLYDGTVRTITERVLSRLAEVYEEEPEWFFTKHS